MKTTQQVMEINEGMLNQIKQLLKENGGHINIPYYCDMCMEDDIISELVEDEYDVREGDEYDNLSFPCLTENGMREEIEIRYDIVGVTTDCYGNVAVINPEQFSYSVYPSQNAYDIENLLSAVIEAVNN